MRCSECFTELDESLIHESHDVPCYLFYEVIGRKAKKDLADKYGRRYLCEKCHKNYEKWLNKMLIGVSEQFAKCYFKELDKEEGYDGNS